MAYIHDRQSEPNWKGYKRWQVRWDNPVGVTPKTPAKSFRTREEAKNFLRDLENTLARHERVDTRAATMSFRALSDKWWVSTVTLKGHTQRGYHRLLHGHVLPYFGDMPQNTITRETVALFKAEKLRPTTKRPKGYDPKYVRDMISVVSLVMKFGMEMTPPLRFDNPADRAGISVRKKKKQAGDANLLSFKDAEKLAAHVRPGYEALVWTLVYTGIRPAELCGLRVAHLSRKKKMLQVDEAFNFIHSYGDVPAVQQRDTTKSVAGDRPIPIPDWLAEMLREMLKERKRRLGVKPGPNDPLFEAVKGGPLNPHKLRRTIILPALKAAKLNVGIRTYDIRHSAATAWIDAGLHPSVIAQLLGHSDTRVQHDTYYHARDKALKGGVEALEKKRRKVAQKKAKKAKAETGTGAQVVQFPKPA